MFKILAPAILLILASTAFVFIRSSSQSVTVPKLNSVITPKPTPIPSPSGVSRVDNLSLLSPNPKPSASASTNQEDRIKTLESALTVLQKRIEILEKSPNKTTATFNTTSSSKSPVYVFSLGSGSSSVKTDWTTLDNIDITINPDDYPGYKNMVLEVYMKVKDGNGKGYARLINPTGGLFVAASEATTTNWDYTWVASSEFNLSSGKKTFKFQTKSLTGYEVFIQSARIKVNF